MPDHPEALAHDLPPEALRILAEGTRLETPCGNGRMVWHAWGDAGGEPLVMLHGGSGSWTHWMRNVLPLAATGRRVIVPDLPGFGDSDPPGGGTDVDAMVEPLGAGLLQLAGDSPLDIAGFSFGAMLATLVAAQQPAQVRQLVLAGAPGLGLRTQRLPLTHWRDLEDPRQVEAAHRRNLATLMLHRPASIDSVAVALQSANVRRDRMRDRKLAMTDIVARTLAQLNCPVGVIYGQEDALYNDRMPQLVALLEGFACVREVVLVAGAGHWVAFENPEDFNRELVRLLKPGAQGAGAG